MKSAVINFQERAVKAIHPERYRSSPALRSFFGVLGQVESESSHRPDVEWQGRQRLEE